MAEVCVATEQEIFEDGPAEPVQRTYIRYLSSLGRDGRDRPFEKARTNLETKVRRVSSDKLLF